VNDEREVCLHVLEKLVVHGDQFVGWLHQVAPWVGFAATRLAAAFPANFAGFSEITLARRGG